MFAPSSFRPAWWLPGPHLQTVGARIIRSQRRIPFTRERLELPDGDFIDLDYPFERPSEEDRPIVVLFHGLEGSARSGYALEIYRKLHAIGIDAIGVNFRSCSGEPNRLPRLYHSGETEDPRHVLSLVAERYPNRSRAAVGVSVGGNILLKLLGELGTDARPLISAAAALSVPYDLGAGADYLMRPGASLYATFLIRKLRRKIHVKRPMLPPEVDYDKALTARGFRAFDDVATAPLHGFAGAEDYYQRSSATHFVEHIRIPTLLLHSADDPFLPASCIPRSKITANPDLVAAFTDRGGHVGFVAGPRPGRPRFWAEGEVARFFHYHLSDGRAT